MATPAVVVALGRSSLFRHLDGQALEALAERAVLRRFRPGQPVFFQGDPGDAVFVLASGAVKLSFSSAQGDEVLLGVVRAPGTFGEVAAVDQGPRTASAEAVEDTQLVAVPCAALSEVMQTRPAVADAVARELAATLRRVTTRMADLVFLDLPGRLAKLLLTLAEADGGSVLPGATIQLDLTQADLAHMIGASRQAVNGVLAGFERRGLIRRDAHVLIVLEPDALRRRADVTT